MTSIVTTKQSRTREEQVSATKQLMTQFNNTRELHFKNPMVVGREVVVGQYICDVLEQNKQKLSPKGTLFVYLRSHFGE